MTAPLDLAALAIARYHNAQATRGNSQDYEIAKVVIDALREGSLERLEAKRQDHSACGAAGEDCVWTMMWEEDRRVVVDTILGSAGGEQ